MSLLSLFGCGKKKNTEPGNIKEWLNTQWPDRFEVVSNLTNITDKDYYYGKRESVIAEKADAEVQFVLHWLKDVKDVGVTKEMVEEELTRSRAEVARARLILPQLKSTGLEKVGLSVSNGDAHILVFTEPSAEQRALVTQRMKEMRARLSEPMHVEVHLMEEKGYGTEFKEIVPEGHWARRDSWQHSNEIFGLSIPIDSKYDLKALLSEWRFNTNSDRTMDCIKAAYTEVLKWKEKHMPADVTVEGEQMVAFGLNEKDGLLIDIDFPYFQGKNEAGEYKSSGMISGQYHFDKGTFTQIRAVKDEVVDDVE